MAITEIVSDITGVGPTASFVLGANTMIPYAGVQIIGLTDGTSPATASKNMAEIYNLNRFERKLAIEMAGLTYDPTDDSQFVRAMQLLPNLSPKRFGTFPSVLAPVSAPSLADPATVKTNLNGEVFMYNGTGWVYVGGGANGFEGLISDIQYPMLPISANTQCFETAVVTITNPSSVRTMKVIFSDTTGYASYNQTAGNIKTDLLVDIIQVGFGSVRLVFMGNCPSDTATFGSGVPVNTLVNITGSAVLSNTDVIVLPGTSKQFKVTMRNNTGATGSVVPGGTSALGVSTTYKTEFLI